MSRERKRQSEPRHSKPRIPTIRIWSDQPLSIGGVEQHDDGSITLYGADGADLVLAGSTGGLQYERIGKGAKVTDSIPVMGSRIGGGAALLEFGKIVGIDTNTRQIGGRSVSATSCIEITNLSFEGRRYSMRVEERLAFARDTPATCPERSAWMGVIAIGEAEGWLRSKGVTLLVVDSSLGELDAMNRREVPVANGLYLPDGYLLGYASADATGSPVNGLIAQCDKCASAIFQKLPPAPAPAGDFVSQS